MKVTETGIPGLLVLQPKVYDDDRGRFYESYHSRDFIHRRLSYFFVQDNEAQSHYGVIRGLHFQRGFYAQAKLVRVTFGRVLDVAVDLRPDSPSYKSVFSIELSHETNEQLLIPRGFAHGYAVLSPFCVFSYKCDQYYMKSSEGGIHPLDPTLNINWQVPSDRQIISEKDRNLPFLDSIQFD
ncbi:MAG TPA: dTDP-4-dehydrorhamnose 3,5-epimerase [Saprospiraceae bacterium]|nr:dTDP-4-dehydrorhamnose 3,5-epimerase [Saprospiraceae bacterium]